MHGGGFYGKIGGMRQYADGKEKQVKKGWIAAAAAALLLAAVCLKDAAGNRLGRFDTEFLGLFDTVTSITGYAEDEETFDRYAGEIRRQLEEYHRLYDRYNTYEGINNIKTINDQAGVAPVEVDPRILGLLEEAVSMYEETGGKLNVAMGSVLTVWHEYREKGNAHPEKARLPEEARLREAMDHMDIRDVIIDREASTVYLADPEMSLDVGAVAKGYAAEQVIRDLERQGAEHLLLNIGGNIRALGSRGDGSPWTAGIQNPDTDSPDRYLHILELEDMSLVTSGSYQRYYTVDGKPYHHIIDPDTGMPENRYVSVTVLCPDSGMADALSTALFNMEPEAGRQLAERMGAEVLWVRPDGMETATPGLDPYLADR